MPQMTAAPYPVTVDGRDFRMSPLGDKDFDELTNWVRASVTQMARLSMTDDMDPSERKEMLEAAMALARSLTFGEASTWGYFKNIEGMSRVFFQGLRKCHPALTFKEFQPLVKRQASIDQLVELMAAWTELNVPEKNVNAGTEAGINDQSPVA